MKLVKQIHNALTAPPKSLSKLNRESAIWLAIYLVLALAVFGLVSAILMENEDRIRQAIFSYIFPNSWHGLAGWIEGFFFESQTKIVLVGMILSGSVIAASVLLFPLKEKCSAVYEVESGLSSGSTEEFPLLLQALEETKLVLLYLTAQLSILWIGYYPYAWASWLSSTLSILFLFYTFGLDLIAPTLQRHRIRYNTILKLLSKNTLLTLGFGCVFSLPMIGLGAVIVSIEDLSLVQMSSILFLLNILTITLAIPVGTYIAVQLFPDVQTTKPPSLTTRRWGYSCLALLLLVNLFFHGRLLQSFHHKSQFLKCEYQVDWDSFNLDTPGLSALFSGKSEIDFSFILQVKNPTAFDLVVENSTLTLEQYGKEFAKVDLDEFSVRSGEVKNNTIHLKSKLDAEALSNFVNLLNGWDIKLEFELFPGIPFAVYVSE